MSMPPNGEAKGTLALRSSGAIAPEILLKFHPEIETELSEIVKKGWKYVCIDARGTAIAQTMLENSSYWLGAAPGFMRKPAATQEIVKSQPEFALTVYIGPVPPEVESVPEVLGFKVNVSSKTFPQAATVDLATGIVTYLHDPFWRWEKGWEADGKKLSEAREVYEVATWLIEVKKFKLIDAFKPERYQELVETFKSMPSLPPADH